MIGFLLNVAEYALTKGPLVPRSLLEDARAELAGVRGLLEGSLEARAELLRTNRSLGLERVELRRQVVELRAGEPGW